ncbi:thioredoxin-related transmembrane protein 1 [Gastrophryne carolinensis]
MAHIQALCLLLLQLLCLPPGLAAKKGDVIDITDSNWRDILHGEWMVEFYAPWCPACQKLQSEWAKFAEWGEDLGVNVAKVDVTAEPGLSGRFIITALPTIYHCKDGVFRKYQGSRTYTDFISFVNEKEWEQLEAISSWFSPDSFLMSGMSALFHLSVYIRNCHNYFLDLGIPVWGSYILFGIFTLFLGLLLGLILVFVSDYLCPAKRHRPQGYPYLEKLSPEAIKFLQDQEKKQRKEEIPDKEDSEETSENDSSKDHLRKRAVKS